MGIVVPGTATNYPSPLVALASPFGREPPEGRYQIPVEIDWGSMGGTDYLCAFNLANSGNTKEITQICAVHVDNSACGSDIQFIFTDTSETVTVAAYAPYVLVPIFSRSLQFFVQAGIDSEVVKSVDVTRFTLFNFVPPPVVSPPLTEQDPGDVAFINVLTASTVLSVGAQNGTVESVNVIYSVAGAAAGTTQIELQDGTGASLAWAQVAMGAGENFTGPIISIPQCQLRYTNGLKIVMTGANIGGSISVNISTRAP